MYSFVKQLLICSVASLGSLAATAQTISTVAGNGTAGYGGDGGPSTAALLNESNALATDASGNIYISDRTNNRIRKIDAAGVITTIVGTGTLGFSGDGGSATLAKLYYPGGVAVDPSGTIYISDCMNQRIRKISSSGIITTIAGNGVASFGGDGGPATTATVDRPLGLALSSTGDLYIADQYNHRVRKISASGIMSTVAGTGTASYGGDGGPATTAVLSFPNFLWMRGTDLYIADNGNHCIRKLNTTTGIISTVAGNGSPGFSGDGGAATAAQLRFTAGIIMDPSGNMYIADNDNNRIRKVDAASNIITTIAGTGVVGYSGDGGPATAARLNNPLGMVFNSSGDLLFNEWHNHTIRKISGLGITNHAPSFTGGASQSLLVCNDGTAAVFNLLLEVLDADAGQMETWNLLTSPTHGTVVAAYSMPSTGLAIAPSGLTYTPALGYTGSDMFQVRVTDGIAADTITINVTVSALPDAGVISGIDSVCPGRTVTLSETVAGGIWSTSNSGISTASSSGVVLGVASGRDTIIYTVINACGIASAIYPFKVRSAAMCPLEVSTIDIADNGHMQVFPNPAQGSFNITISSAIDEQAKVSVIGITGELVKEYTCHTNTPMPLTLDVPAGMYLINAASAGGSVWHEKLIIRR